MHALNSVQLYTWLVAYEYVMADWYNIFQIIGYKINQFYVAIIVTCIDLEEFLWLCE